MKQGRLSAEAIKAPWHRSIALTMSRLDEEFQVDPKEWTKYLQQFDLRDTMSDQAYRYQYTARQQLELDLALSTDVFSEMASKPDKVDQALEVMTEALSLSAEPPSVEFGYLRPLERKHRGEDEKVLETPDIPMGVRLLLKHWGWGSPESYPYRDPYNDSGSIDLIKSPAVPPIEDFVARRPPAVMASKQTVVNILPDTFKPVTKSQEAPPRYDLTFGAGPFSTPILSEDISTQVLPGPHGGRKKMVKKRIGGF